MRRTRASAPVALVALCLATLAAPALAGPFSWPNVPERIERGLASTDVAERRAVARRLVDAPRELAAPLIRRALGDPDVEVRLLAAAAAVASELPSAGDLVVTWIAETDVRLRLAACNVVRAAPTPSSATALGRALADASAEVRAAAAAALGTSSLAEAVSPLLGHIDDASPEVRGEVVRALGRLRDARAVLPLVGRLQDAAPEVRRAAARALRELGDVRAAPALVVALSDASPQVRLEVVEALGALRSSEAVLALIPIALGGTSSSAQTSAASPPRSESGEVLRAASLRALARIPEPRALAAIVAALPLDDPDASDLARAAVAPSAAVPVTPRGVTLAAGGPASPTSGLASTPLGSATPAGDALVAAGARAVPALVDALRGAMGPRALSSAARALATLDGQAAVPAIARAMLAGALPTRAGLTALARTGRPEALPMVLERLDDPEPLVRSAALSAALQLVDPARPDGRVVDPAAATLRDARRPQGERIALLRLLGRSGSPRAHATLLGLLAPGSGDRLADGAAGASRARADEARRLPARVAAIEALGALGIATAASDRALVAALDDESPAVRRAASAALSKAGSPAVAVALVQRLTEGAEQDRGALAVALSGVASRARSDATGEALAEAAERAPSDVRDGILEALGRAPGESAREALLGAARSPDPDERRKVAEALAGHGATTEGRAALLRLAADTDASVRAAALWTLGRVGERSDAALLAKAITDADATVSGNAAAALGRLASRLRAPDLAAGALCRAVDDGRPYIAVNALAGIVQLGAACDVARVGALLGSRRPAVVRAAAARFLTARRGAGSADPEVELLLSRCATDERDADIASICTGPSRPPKADGGAPLVPRDLLVFVVTDGGSEPRPRAPFALARSDGFVRLGIADRRGAVLERDLPPGEVRLEVPAPLVR